MKQNTTKEAFAKINLTLDIKGVREDGYHEVAMYMQSISLHDTLTVTARTDERITLDITFEEGYRAPEELLSADADNLCVRAARAMNERIGLPTGYDIALIKRIPVGAGLAGGSTDAAAVLCAINEMIGEDGKALGIKELMTLAAPLGADIPYCILGGTRLAIGTGTTLVDAPEAPRLSLVLIKPEISMPTGLIYRAYDHMDKPLHPDNAAMERALAQGDVTAIADAMGNALEPVVAAEYPVIDEIKNALKEAGASGAMMSGSGSCVYGIFKDETTAARAKDTLCRRYPEMFVYRGHTTLVNCTDF